MGDRKVTEPWRTGNHFCGERTGAGGGGENAADRDHVRKALPPKATRERKRVKTLTGNWARNLFPKTITE